ncbi:hypothetical protein M9Y10_033430 [Tritrichomonas musculus]|uniref:Thioredoxin domain-containing protein n=1 Tax=Tritrichomonas musculus TaxID=1915356 RepID=A0ABR2KD72_9EUKA
MGNNQAAPTFPGLPSKTVVEPPDNLINAPNKLTAADLDSKITEPNAIQVVCCLAPYCSISRGLNSALPQLASEFPTVTFYKVNTEKNQEIPAKFNVQIIPYTAIIVKKNGGDPFEHAHVTGNEPDEIRKILNELTKPPEEPKKSPLEKLKELGKSLEDKDKDKDKGKEKDKKKDNEKSKK